MVRSIWSLPKLYVLLKLKTGRTNPASDGSTASVAVLKENKLLPELKGEIVNGLACVSETVARQSRLIGQPNQPAFKFARGHCSAKETCSSLIVSDNYDHGIIKLQAGALLWVCPSHSLRGMGALSLLVGNCGCSIVLGYGTGNPVLLSFKLSFCLKSR